MWATWPGRAGPRPSGGGPLLLLHRVRTAAGRVGPSPGPPGLGTADPEKEWRRRLDSSALRAYLPDLTEEEPVSGRLAARPDPYAHPVSALRRILVETRAYDALASDVDLPSTARISRSSICRGPTRSATSSRPTRRHAAGGWGKALTSSDSTVSPKSISRRLIVYREYRKLGVERQGAVLMLASDHGFLWSEARPERSRAPRRLRPGSGTGTRGWYLLWGPGIVPAPESGGVAQVCVHPPRPPRPAARLPASRVRPCRGAPAAGGGDGGLPEDSSCRPHRQLKLASSGGDVDKLRALGYIGGSEPERAPAGSGSTRTPASYNNEGLLRRQAGRTREAVAAFESALRLDPRSASALWNLSDLLHAEKREPERSDDLLVQAAAAGLPEAADGPERAPWISCVQVRPGGLCGCSTEPWPLSRTTLACASSAAVTAWRPRTARRRKQTSRKPHASRRRTPSPGPLSASPSFASAMPWRPAGRSNGRCGSIPRSRGCGRRLGASEGAMCYIRSH